MKTAKKLISFFVVLAMVFCIAQPAFGTDGKGIKTASLNFSVISDPHYYPRSLMGDKSEAWYEACRLEAKEYNESDAIIDAALTAIGENAKENGTEYLLIPGDLTRNSEYEAHVQLAKKLEAFENKYGVQVVVINGNHDINVSAAVSYETNEPVQTRSITPFEFEEVYKNLGYDLAVERYTPPANDRHGYLSYVADLGDDYSIIVIDGCVYNFDNAVHSVTSGYISDHQMNWILEQTEKIKAEGKTPFAMIHHGLAPHMKIEPSVTAAFVVDDYLTVSETLADAGVNYAFTGHLHTNDIANVVSDKGNVLYDCETPSITGYPNLFRNVEFETYTSGQTFASYKCEEADSVVPISVDGKTYPKNTFKYESFSLCFGGALSEDGKPDLTEFLLGLVKNFAGGYIKDMKKAGSVSDWLKVKMNLDLEDIIASFLEPYIGNGIGLGGYEIFSAENIMWFVDDLLDQLLVTYGEDMDYLCEKLRPALNKILKLQVSEVPCDKFIKDYGFGDATKGGTLGDAVLSAMVYWFSGNEDISNDAFLLDTIENLENGDTAFELFDILLDVAFNDLIDDLLLSHLEIRLDKLFGETKIGKKLGSELNHVLSYILRDDFSYKNLVDTIFGLGVLPYTSIFDIVDKLVIKEYLTPSQLESVGHTLAYTLSDFATDINPIKSGDSEVTYSSKAITPVATRENYRLPTMLSVTMGNDSKTSAYINWFSKSSLPATDIEIYEMNGSPISFTGVPTESASFTISTSEKLVERYYPGIDIGIIGVFKYNFNMYQHTVSLTNLKPGTKYAYKVGNAEYGWWSEAGTVETSGNDTSVTFFHMSDPQSQNEKQYTEAWANTVDKAFELYPEAKFICNTGDLVDCGMNTNQWQWMFDTASDNLKNTYLMPATGNHEEKDDYSTVSNFVLPNMPEQDTTTGVYYSYTYNNVHVAVLNTNNLDENEALNPEQIEWLKKDMEASDAQWKVLAFHKALYSNGSHYDDEDVCAMRDQLCSLIPELNIDLVLQGHDHVYLRTHSLDGNKVVDEEKTALEYNGQVYDTYVNPTGASYVIDGCSGVKTYVIKGVDLTDQLFPRAAKIESADSQIFSAIQIVDGVLYFNAYKVTGDKYECIDKFAIQKDGSGVKTDKTPDIVPDEVETPEEDCIFTKIIEVLKKILTVAWNIFRMYFLEYAWIK